MTIEKIESGIRGEKIFFAIIGNNLKLFATMLYLLIFTIMKRTILFLVFILFSCLTFAQNGIIILIDTANSTHIPARDPSVPDDENLYVNLCPNETFILSVKGQYPDNTQSDQTTNFSYIYNGGFFSGTGMTSHQFEVEPGAGYDVVVTANDYPYSSETPLKFRIRTSANPIRNILEIPSICPGERADLSIGYDENSTITLQNITRRPFSDTQRATIKQDTFFIADMNISCPPLPFYKQQFIIISLNQSDIIQNVDDILYLAINMEHSNMGNLQLDLICPNGRRTSLLPNYNNYPSGSNRDAWLGEPNLNDTIPACDALSNPFGRGWDYVWSENTNRGYSYSASPNSAVSDTDNISLNNTANPSSLPSKSNFYKPYQSFSNLIGCPVSGAWEIVITDYISNDNGYIFSCELALHERFFTEDWDFSVEVPNAYFIPDPHAEYVAVDRVGNLLYTAIIEDTYGCRYDTTLTIRMGDVTESIPTVQTRSTEGEPIATAETNLQQAELLKWDANDLGKTLREYEEKVDRENFPAIEANLVKRCPETYREINLIRKELTFPNIITPNGDGFNDLFAIGNLQYHLSKPNELVIYNRWGQTVYRAKNYDTYSQGKKIMPGTQQFNGDRLPEGTYYFVFTLDGKIYKGNLMIKR